MARSTVFRFKGRADDPVSAGRQIGVRAVLTGRVSQAGGQLVVIAELVDTADGARLWGAHYSRPSSNVFEAQEEIAREVSDRLCRELTGAERERVLKRHTESEAAYRLYLKGRYYWNKRLTEDLLRGISCFRQAIDEDPTYARAYVGIADCFDLLCGVSALPPREGFPKAKAAVMKALELDGELAEAHASLAHQHMRYDWDWAAAEEEYLRALALNPNYAVAHHWYSIHLTITGRHDEALAESARARCLDPLSHMIDLFAGAHLYYARRYDEALSHFQKTAEAEPRSVHAHTFLGQVYAQTGRHGKAVAAIRAARRLSGQKEDASLELLLGYFYARAGKTREAHAVLAEMKRRGERAFISPFEIAQIHAGLNEADDAFAWLETSFQERISDLIFLKVMPEFDNVRGDPRFAGLLGRLGLTEARGIFQSQM